MDDLRYPRSRHVASVHTDWRSTAWRAAQGAGRSRSRTRYSPVAGSQVRPASMGTGRTTSRLPPLALATREGLEIRAVVRDRGGVVSWARFTSQQREWPLAPRGSVTNRPRNVPRFGRVNAVVHVERVTQ